MNPLFLLIPILLPMAGGFAILRIHPDDDRRRAVFAEATAAVTSAAVLILISLADGRQAVLYSFMEGFSIALGADGAGKLFAGMVAVMWPFALLYAFSYMEGESGRKNVFFAFYLISYGVTLGIAFAANLTTVYVFFEMLTLVTIPLVSYYGDHEGMYAGRVYAAFTIGGAALAFMSVLAASVWGEGSFVYGGSIRENAPEALMHIAFFLGFIGFGAKAAIFPLHAWLPRASVAPTPVTALLHAVAVVNSGVFAVIRLCWYCFRPEMIAGTVWHTICICLTAFTMVYAAAMAVKERHFKRRLAYSTVSNLSYMLFGIALLTQEGLAGGLSHMVFHGIMKLSLFLCAGAFMKKTGRAYIYEMNGAGRRMPFIFICYTTGALALTGIPLTCGFVSKWALLMAGFGEGSVFAFAGTAALMISAFLCAVYTLTPCIRAFFPVRGRDGFAASDARLDPDWRMCLPIAVFTLLILVFGFFPGPVMKLVEEIAGGVR